MLQQIRSLAASPAPTLYLPFTINIEEKLSQAIALSPLLWSRINVFQQDVPPEIEIEMEIEIEIENPSLLVCLVFFWPSKIWYLRTSYVTCRCYHITTSSYYLARTRASSAIAGSLSMWQFANSSQLDEKCHQWRLATGDLRLATIGGLGSGTAGPGHRQCSVRFDGGNLAGLGCCGRYQGLRRGRGRGIGNLGGGLRIVPCIWKQSRAHYIHYCEEWGRCQRRPHSYIQVCHKYMPLTYRVMPESGGHWRVPYCRFVIHALHCMEYVVHTTTHVHEDSELLGC